MIDPIHASGCIFDEDGYFYQNGEGEEYAANPFGDPFDLFGDGGGEEYEE